MGPLQKKCVLEDYEELKSHIFWNIDWTNGPKWTKLGSHGWIGIIHKLYKQFWKISILRLPPGPPKGPWGAKKSGICKFLRIIDMLYIKIDPNDMETHWNTSYNGICILGAPQFSLRGSQGPPKGPQGAQKLLFCQIWWNIGMLYVKIDPKDTETHWNTSYYETCMSRAPQPHLRGS